MLSVTVWDPVEVFGGGDRSRLPIVLCLVLFSVGRRGGNRDQMKFVRKIENPKTVDFFPSRRNTKPTNIKPKQLD